MISKLASEIQPLHSSTTQFDHMKSQEFTPSPTDSLEMSNMAIELAVEKSRCSLAISARDAVVGRLVEAFAMMRLTGEELDELKRQHLPEGTWTKSDQCRFTLDLESLPGYQDSTSLRDQLRSTEQEVQSLRIERDSLIKTNLKLEKDLAEYKSCSSGSLPGYGDDDIPLLFRSPSGTPAHAPQYHPPPSPPTAIQAVATATQAGDAIKFDDRDDPAITIRARHAVLANLPPLVELPAEVLQPIVLPSWTSFPEFLRGLASGPLTPWLSNYYFLRQATTNWCPQHEEHGYFLSPVYRCATVPRVSMAHRWEAVDVMRGLDSPVECFYDKDGKWYYAGRYQAFRMDDLTIGEYNMLSPETASVLAKKTLQARHNTSPANVHETLQLYGCGALRVGFVGMKCVGFNRELYQEVLNQANAYAGRSVSRDYLSSLPAGRDAPATTRPANGTFWNVSSPIGARAGDCVPEMSEYHLMSHWAKLSLHPSSSVQGEEFSRGGGRFPMASPHEKGEDVKVKL